MAYRRLPNTVSSTLRNLMAARDTYIATSVAADRAISAAQFAQLDPGVPGNVLNRLIAAASTSDNALAAQAPLTSDLSQKAARLTMFVSHFHQALDMAIARGVYPAGVRAFYNRPVGSAVLPDMSTYAALKIAAARIATGEAARAAAEGAGYIAMANPSAADVAAVAGPFNTTLTAQRNAVTATDLSQEAVQALYNEAHTLAVDICDTVEFFYRHDPNAASRRRKCIRWGVVYVYAPGESDGPAAPVITASFNTTENKVEVDVPAGDFVTVRVQRQTDESGDFNTVVEGPGTTFLLDDQPSGTHRYRVTVLDADGNESDPSNEVEITVP